MEHMDRLGFDFDEKLRNDPVFYDRYCRDLKDAARILREDGQLFFGVLTGVGFEGRTHRFEGEWISFDSIPVYDPGVMPEGNESLTEARQRLMKGLRDSFPFAADWSLSGFYNCEESSPRSYALFLTDGQEFIRVAQCRYSEYTGRYSVNRDKMKENTIRDMVDGRNWRMEWYEFTNRQDGELIIDPFYM